jgi:uncharacterized damage-inducible protein DinB
MPSVRRSREAVSRLVMSMMTIMKQIALCAIAMMILGRFGLEANRPPSRDANAAGALQDLISSTEKLVTNLATDMPDDKYNFVPPATAGDFHGVRSFAKQLKHAGAVQYLAANSILGEPVTAEMAEERGPDSARSKADVLKYVAGSFAALHRAAATVDETNAFAPMKGVFGSTPTTRAGLIAGALTHSSNHYGQMVEYARMNAIIPPESR